jgi:cytochrome c-type biogenesis protein
MTELIAAFALGNGAILTNACMLPLYPGLIAFLAGQSGSDRVRNANIWLGVLVLAGIMTMLLLVGFVLYLLQASFGPVLLIMLPLLYVTAIGLGVTMLAGYNPFVRLSTVQAPVLKNSYATAYVYGLLFGPMTLPCTGPIITGVFLLGVGSAAALLDGMLYFVAFGLGFGWPLLVLPLVAGAAQRRFVGWTNRNHPLLTRVAGILLIGVGVYGIVTELVPNVTI